MKIGLISDTHIARSGEIIPPQVETAFNNVDMILHAGDIWIPSALDELETIAPVIAAWGDDDMEHDLGEDPRMSSDRVLQIDGLTFWLVHEKPPYGHIVPRENKVFSRTPETDHVIPDIVVYGHTHKSRIEHYKGVMIVNPGSPTWPNNFPELGTVAILTLESGNHHVEIIDLKQI
ncbi:MAG: metallophosphoesterase family protein [Dehalococcoidales bacterium]|nr:metallophosphoesterase family protein [Dehalococcoidales bacterium]